MDVMGNWLGFLKKNPEPFSSSKNELIYHHTYHTRDKASRDSFAFIEGFYNRQRLYQSLGYLSPLEFEQRMSDP